MSLFLQSRKAVGCFFSRLIATRGEISAGQREGEREGGREGATDGGGEMAKKRKRRGRHISFGPFFPPFPRQQQKMEGALFAAVF